MPVAAPGPRGTHDFLEELVVTSFAEAIYRRNPKGDLALNAILRKSKPRKLRGYERRWPLKNRPMASGELTANACYDDSGLGTPYTAAADAAGTPVYIKMAEDFAQEFRVGHQVQLTKVGDPRYDKQAEVNDVILAGDNSRIGVKLLETASATYGLDEVDWISVVSNLNPQFGTRPNIVKYDPDIYYNYTSIVDTAYGLSGTAETTELKTGDALGEERREKADIHADELEGAMILGIRTKGHAPNGHLKTSMGGLKFMAETYSDYVSNYKFDEEFDGLTWLEGGKLFLEKWLREYSTHNSGEVFGLCGQGAEDGFTALAEYHGQVNITPDTDEYGLRIKRWRHAGVDVGLRTHPRFKVHPNLQNAVLLFDPDLLHAYYTRYTRAIERGQNESSEDFLDGRLGMWRTEATIQYDSPPDLGFFQGIGLDNPA